METSEHSKSQLEERRHWFETVMEVTVSTAPLILVVLGIGMMSFAPRRSAVPLFHSQQEAQEFYAHNGMNFSYEYPVLITASSCAKCDELKASLKEIGVQFVEQNVDNNAPASNLHSIATRVSGSEKLPQVVLGDQLVYPAPYSIRVAMRRFHK